MPRPSLVTTYGSDRNPTVRLRGVATANGVVARAAVEGALVVRDKVVARAAVEDASKVEDDLIVALLAVGGAEVVADSVVARAAEEDVTLIERSYEIITTEATEHVGASGSLALEVVVILGAAVEGVV